METIAYLKNLFEKTETDFELDNYNPFIINRFLSMNKSYLPLISKMDRFVFGITKQLHYIYFDVLFPKQKQRFFRYIKKKKVIPNEFDFLLTKIKSYYGFSNKEMEKLELFYKNEFQKNLKSYFEFFGVEKKYWKKFGLKFQKSKKIQDNKIKHNF